MLEEFMPNLIHTSLIGSVGIILLIVLRKSLLKKYTQNFSYYIWLLIIVRLVIPFKIPIYVSSQIYNIFNSICADKIKDQSTVYKSSAINPNNVPNNDSIMVIVAYIWIVGVIIASVYYIYTYLKLIRNIKCFTYEVNENEIINIYREIMHKLRINKKICLKYYNGINSPFGVGILKPCIVIPRDSYNYTEIKLILTHELIHFKKHDLLYKITLVAVKILHWFNPLVYVMCNLANADCELACDESLLKDSGVEERKLYAMTFVNSLRFNKKINFENGIITGFNNNNKNILKRRIENMLNLRNKKRGVLIGTLSAMIIASSLISINVFAQNNSKQIKNNLKISDKNSIGKASGDLIKIGKQKPGEYVSKGMTLRNVINDKGEVVKAYVPVEVPNNLPIHETQAAIDIATKEYNTNPNQTVRESITPNQKYKKYTYSNAPESARVQYELDCKANNTKPDPSHEIYVLQN